MDNKSIVGMVFILCVAACAIFITSNYFSLQREITVQDKQTQRVLAVEDEVTQRALKVEDKETERVEAIQGEKTNRTEERSKFWNKLVPWNNETAVFDGTKLGEDL